MTNTNRAGIFVVYNAHGVSELFHSAIVDAILAGGTLPDELADLLTLKPIEVDGSIRWIVDYA